MKEYKVFFLDGNSFYVHAERFELMPSGIRFYIGDRLIAEFGDKLAGGWVELIPKPPKD